MESNAYTLIIPCAGKSNRFPGMKPKWLLTHPDGKLMIEKALNGFDTPACKKIIISIVKEHDEKYEASLILKQVFADNPKVHICILDSFTKSASQTVYLTLEKNGVEGAFIVKDSDNFVGATLPKESSNFIVGYNIDKHRDVTNIPGKSFLISNEQRIISDIVEKKVVSNIICLGVYGFESADAFKNSYLELAKNELSGELFVSHVISYILSSKMGIFVQVEADAYEDWGTLSEWTQVQRKSRTYFVDVDGVIMKNCGKYGATNWYNNREVLSKNAEVLKRIQDEGGQIVITTSRPEEFRKDLEAILSELGLKPYAILMGLNHAARVVLNDFAPTNPYPSAMAVSVPRNADIENYFKHL